MKRIFKEVMQEFIENQLDHQYKIEEYKLSKNYPEDLLIEARTGGSSGGNCYGGYSSEYRIDTDDILYDIISSVNYIISDSEVKKYINVPIKETIEKHLKETLISFDEVGENSGTSDYYGNYSTSKIYRVPLVELMRNLLSEDHINILMELLSINSITLNEKFDERKRLIKLEDLNKKIKDFENNTFEEKNLLEKNLKNYENMVESIKKSLITFDEDKEKQLKKLKAELAKIDSTSEKKSLKI